MKIAEENESKKATTKAKGAQDWTGVCVVGTS